MCCLQLHSLFVGHSCITIVMISSVIASTPQSHFCALYIHVHVCAMYIHVHVHVCHNTCTCDSFYPTSKDGSAHVSLMHEFYDLHVHNVHVSHNYTCTGVYVLAAIP